MCIPVITIFLQILIWLPAANTLGNSEFRLIILALGEFEENKQFTVTLSNNFKSLLL